MQSIAGRLITSVYCLSLCGALHAAPQASTSPDAPLAQAARPIDRDHRLRPGDVLEISVNEREELSRTVRLFTDGTFNFPFLGAVKAGGLTVNELSALMANGLKSELRRPVVSVTLKEAYIPPHARVPKVTVLGAVTTRGEIDLPEPKPLRALLAQVGPTERADLSSIRVRSRDGTVRTADFSRFHLTGQAPDDFLLEGGEEVLVLERPSAVKPEDLRVNVLGAVQKPGSVAVSEGTTILDVLDKVGGASPGADLQRVIVKGPAHAAPLTVNVARYMGGDTASGYSVRAGDEVIVPEKPQRVLVVGEVLKPGELAVDANASVLDVYLQTGVTPNGDPARAQWIRRGANDKPVARTINLFDVMRGKTKATPVMAAGDVLFIPPKRGQKRGLLDYLGALASPVWLLRGLAGG